MLKKIQRSALTSWITLLEM